MLSFLEFFFIYGYFVGEELEEDDEVFGLNEYFLFGEDMDEYESDEECELMEDSVFLIFLRCWWRRKICGGSG